MTETPQQKRERLRALGEEWDRRVLETVSSFPRACCRVATAKWMGLELSTVKRITNAHEQRLARQEQRLHQAPGARKRANVPSGCPAPEGNLS